MTVLKDNVTPLLDSLSVSIRGMSNEALSKSGAKLRSAMVAKSRSYGVLRSGLGISQKDRRVLVASGEIGSDKFKRSFIKRAFSRHAHDSSISAGADVGELIRFRLYDDSSVMLVGYFDTPSFTPKIYRDGKVVGKGARVKGVGGLRELGKRLEYGFKQTLSDSQKRLFKASGWGKAVKRGQIQTTARAVVMPVALRNHTQTLELMKNSFLNLFSRKINAA